MVVAKRTIKNQLTLPKAVVEQAGIADYYDVICDNGRIVFTPLLAVLDTNVGVKTFLKAGA